MFEFWETVQSVLAGPASHNLYGYLSQATLQPMKPSRHAPPIPERGHKSHRNRLSIVMQRYRALETIHKIRDEVFSRSAIHFLAEHVPSHPIHRSDVDEALDERMTVPCRPHFNIPFQEYARPSNLEGVFGWVEELPLMTLQRVIHMIDPTTKDWSFRLDTQPSYDAEIFRHVTWGPSDRNARGLVTVIVQPPWILSPRDLELFVRCQGMPRYDTENPNPLKYCAKERLWAKIWDVCFREKTRWFVVTTYWGWVFGAFSRGWTRAFCSNVQSYQQSKPTVLQSLVYWFGSAMGEEFGWQIPEVPESVDSVGLELRCSIPQSSRSRFIPADSNSSWTANSGSGLARSEASAIDSDDGVKELLAPTGFPEDESDDDELDAIELDDGDQSDDKRPVLLDELPSHGPKERILWWQRSMGVRTMGPTISRPTRSLSPTLSESSASTIRDCNDDYDCRGFWLASGNPSEQRADYE